MNIKPKILSTFTFLMIKKWCDFIRLLTKKRLVHIVMEIDTSIIKNRGGNKSLNNIFEFTDIFYIQLKSYLKTHNINSNIFEKLNENIKFLLYHKFIPRIYDNCASYETMKNVLGRTF